MSWFRSRKLRDLRGRVEDQMVALWNRNQLIADQDQVITELRGENRTLQQDITRLRADIEVIAHERDYWQGKAANP